jgi:hypothetical protein
MLYIARVILHIGQNVESHLLNGLMKFGLTGIPLPQTRHKVLRHGSHGSVPLL